MLRRLTFAAVPLSLIALLVLLSGQPPTISGKSPDEKSNPVPRYAEVVPATNPVRLFLQDDGVRLLGWVSGEPKKLGEVATLKVGDSGKVVKVALKEDHTFRWDYRLDKPTEVEVTLSDGNAPLQESLLLIPAKAEPEPSVFFVVDRTAYRPGQNLMFAGFLRRLSAKGDFEPIPNAEVEVSLVSQQKKTTAGKFKLTSDESGRIEGAYTFSEGDALDNYTLAVKGYKGSASVLLGEYRKSKIKLKIGGEIADRKAELKFETVDFLDKAVEVSKLHFDVQVQQRTRRASADRPLKAEDFVHHLRNASFNNEFDDLPEEDRLLWLADHVFPSSMGFVQGVVYQSSHDAVPQGKEPYTFSLPLDPNWTGDGFEVVVQGVVTDANGREQRSVKSIPLAPNSVESKKTRLVLGKESFAVNETVQAKLTRADGKPEEGATSLVVMRLSPAEPGGYYYDRFSNLNHVPLRGSGLYSRRGWAPSPDRAKRTLVTALPFKGDVASVKIQEPGAYKLVAITHRDDGSTTRCEVGCLVRPSDAINPLTVELEADTLQAGDALKGDIYSRFANARVLLTLRDSSGFKFAKSLKLDDKGYARLDVLLPPGVRYGCQLELTYPDEKDREFTATRFVRVNPTDRMLNVKTALKEEVAPGEGMKLDLQVDRQEEVDLIVSVYDQALLGIAPDRGVNIKDFYLADERVRTARLRDRVRQQVGNVTLRELARRAEELLQERGNEPDPARAQLQQIIHLVKNNQYVQTPQLVGLLRLAGVEIQANPAAAWLGVSWYVQVKPEMKLTDVLDLKHGEFSVTLDLIGDRVVLSEWHPSYAQHGNTLAMYGNRYGRYRYNNYYQNNLFLENSGGMGRAARGDSSWSISGNSSRSFAEGQAAFSHVPVGPSAVPIEAAPDQGSIYIRRDFSDSAYWNARVRTDANGKASVDFKVPDSLTNWQVVVTAVSKRMHVGQAKTQFRTFKPIMVWPMLPRVFTQGDHVDVFASVHNRTDAEQSIEVRLKAENAEVLSRESTTVVVPAKSSVPVYWSFQPKSVGFTQLLMTANCAAGSDASLKRLPVMRSTVEEVFTASGRVRDGVTFKLPEGIDLNSARLEMNFAPSLAADMADTLDYLVDYPYGCVEQTMSRFLPAIKVAQVLQNFHIDHPGLNKKLPGCVSGGIKRLLELQQPDGGWAWHGNGQTHEMMTPYALFGLLQAEKAGYTIPSEHAVTSGLTRLRQFIDGMNENQAADRIYCMYVYAHRHDLQAEWWTWLDQQLAAKRLSDYALALALEMSVQKGKKELASKFAEALRARATQEGSHVYWTTANFSRWGNDRFEITAAAMKALVAHDKADPLIDSILSFFTATKRGDRWNSTKDTAMIVYAICDYLAAERVGIDAKGTLTYRVNDGKETEVKFDNQLTQKVNSTALSLKPGSNELTFKTEMRGVMYRLVLRYWKEGQNIEALARGIDVKRSFFLLDYKGANVKELKSGDTVPRGSYILSRVDATSKLHEGMRYVLVENPKPSTAEVLPVTDSRFSQYASTQYVLREERDGSVAFHHEQTGNHLSDCCVLLAEMSGEFVISPAYVELMYQTEVRGHSGSFTLKVAEKK